ATGPWTFRERSTVVRRLMRSACGAPLAAAGPVAATIAASPTATVRQGIAARRAELLKTTVTNCCNLQPHPRGAPAASNGGRPRPRLHRHSAGHGQPGQRRADAALDRRWADLLAE